MSKKFKSLQPSAIPAQGKPQFARLRNMSSLKPIVVAAATAMLAIGYYGNAGASATAVYIGQAAAGTGDGSSCANAHAASWFNSSSNWGTGATQIGGGTTVHLCGTVSSGLTFQGSGASGAPVTLDGAGATYSGEVNTANRSWWRVQNVTWSTAYTGSLVTVMGGSNGVINGNTADNIQHGIFLAQYNGSVLPSNITVSNNWLRQTAADLGNTQHDVITTEGSSNVVIEGNYIEMRTGGAGNEAHNDAIQTYEKGGSTGGPPSDWTIRYNQIVMNSAATNDRSWMMLESLKGTINIHDNLLLGLNGASSANGISSSSNDSSVVFNIYNNTFVSKSNASNNMLNLAAPGVANLKNNIFSAVSQTMLTGSMTVKRDHNLWNGSYAPSCSGQTGELCGVDPMFADYASNNFTPADNSPTLAAGANLGTAYGKILAKGASFPKPLQLDRAATGNWTLGAFSNQASAVVLPAPTSLRVVQ